MPKSPREALSTLPPFTYGKDAFNDYASLQLTEADIPTLCDLILEEIDPDAPMGDRDPYDLSMHAARALYRCFGVTGLRSLVEVQNRMQERDEDWLFELMDLAISEVGPAGIPLAREILMGGTFCDEITRCFASCLGLVAKENPECAGEASALLREFLGSNPEMDSETASFAVCGLLEIASPDHLPFLRECFAAGMNDPQIVGWESVLSVIPDAGPDPSPAWNRLGGRRLMPQLSPISMSGGGDGDFTSSRKQISKVAKKKKKVKNKKKRLGRR